MDGWRERESTRGHTINKDHRLHHVKPGHQTLLHQALRQQQQLLQQQLEQEQEPHMQRRVCVS